MMATKAYNHALAAVVYDARRLPLTHRKVTQQSSEPHKLEVFHYPEDPKDPDNSKHANRAEGVVTGDCHPGAITSQGACPRPLHT